MTAKPPPADPELFAESLPQAASPELALSNIPDEFTGMAASELLEIAGAHSEIKSAEVQDLDQSVAGALASASAAEPATQARGVARRSTKIKLMVITSALLGLAIGFVVARSKKHQTESMSRTVPSTALSASVAPTTSTPVETNSKKSGGTGSREALRPTSEPNKPLVTASHPSKASSTMRSGKPSKKTLPKATPNTAEDSEPAWVEPK